MRGISRFVIAVLAACAATQPQAATVEAVPGFLPEAPEREWVTTYCSKCHQTAWIGLAGGTELGWATRIRRMVRRGAVIPADRIAPLARYLAAALPPRIRADELAASPITTSVSSVELRPLQVWVRSAGSGGAIPGRITVPLPIDQATLVRPGQRVRAFQLRSRASMYQGEIVAVLSHAGVASAQIALRSIGEEHQEYLVEIIADHGLQLSIPNEAVIEEGDRQVAYVRQTNGDYVPRQIRTGRRGELFVEVLEGLSAGEEVVTFGSFFIDAEFRMKGVVQP